MSKHAYLIVAATCCLYSVSAAQEKAGSTSRQVRSDLEDRLLKAEMLEVSAGDLDEAMAAYEAIRNDEHAPEDVRARATLYLARCHRKRAELKAAETLLTALIEQGNTEREVLRQARSFLRELRRGEPENPDFDWLSQLESNPEIQARVFDLAMDLVDPDKDVVNRGRRQLIALGPLVAPVVERVLELTRDRRHRNELAVILLHAGRYERLRILLDPDDPSTHSYSNSLQRFAWSLPYLPDDERSRFVAELNKVPRHPETDPLRALLALLAGDTSDLEANLRQIARVGLRSSSDFERVWDVIERQNAYDRFIPVAREFQGWIGGYFRNHYLRRHNPVDAPSTWARILRAAGSYHYLRWLAERYDEALPDFVAFLNVRAKEAPEYNGEYERVAPGRRGGPAPEWTPSQAFAEAMAGLLDSGDPVVLAVALEALALAPPGTGPEILPELEQLVREPPDLPVREFAFYALLKRFASRPETGPDVARIFAEDYARRSGKALPVSYLESPLAAVRQMGSLTSKPYFEGQGESARLRSRTRSVPMHDITLFDIRLMGRLLQNVSPDTRLNLLPHIIALAASHEVEPFLQWHVDELLSRRVRWDRVGEKLVTHLPSFKHPKVRMAAMGLLDEPPSPVRPSRSRHGAQRRPGDFLAKTAEGLAFLEATATDRDIPAEVRRKALLLGGDAGAGWFDWAAFMASDDPLKAELARHRELSHWVRDQPEHLRAIATNRDIALEIRKWAFSLGGDAAAEWFDWAALAGSDDPLAVELARRRELFVWVRDEPLEKRISVLQAALGNAHERVRSAAVARYLTEAADWADVIDQALHDPSVRVQNVALGRIQDRPLDRFVPRVVELLEDLPREEGLTLFRTLQALAAPQSVEPLSKLLDHPDRSVRSNAQETIEKIHEALTKQREWQQLIEEIRAAQALRQQREKENAPPPPQ